MEQAVMKTQILVGVAASLALNVLVLAGLDWSVHQAAQVGPPGVVSVIQLADPTDLQAYALVSEAPTAARL
jgi:hypothetical protein